jgi:hypothetical protein
MLIGTSALASGGGAANSGVEGTITLSPAGGGPQRESASAQAPYAGVEVRLVGHGGAVVASARTSPAGHFVLPAPAGTYQLQVMTPIKFTRCPSPAVQVAQQQVSVVDIDCDSGMR